MRKFYTSLLVLAALAVSTLAKAQTDSTAAAPVTPTVSGLNIVKNYTLSLPAFIEGNAYEGFEAQEVLAGLTEALGIVSAENDSTAVEPELLTEAAKGNELISANDTGTDGWYGRADGKEYNLPQGWGTTKTLADSTTVNTNTFYLQGLQLAGDTLTISAAGQFPGVLKGGDTDYTYIYIVYGGKAARVKVQASVKTPIDLPDAPTSVKELNILATKTASAEIYYGKTGEAAVDIAELLAKLPTDDKELAAYALEDLIFVQPEGEEGALDTLVTNLRLKYDEVSKTSLSVGDGYEWAVGGDGFDEDGKYVIGIYLTKTLAAGDERSADLYIAYGKDAVKVTLSVKVLEPVKVDYTEVGSVTVKVKAAPDDTYATTPFSVPDMSAVYEALGMKEGSLEDIYAWESEGVITNDHTEGSGGFFYNKEGYVDAWGSTASHFVAISSIPNGEFTVGQMEGAYTNITEPVVTNTAIIFLNEDEGKYFTLNLEYTVALPEAGDIGTDPDKEFDIVATIPVSVQLIPNSVYLDDDATSDAIRKQSIRELGIETLQNLIGEGTYAVKLLKAPATPEAYPVVSGPSGYGVEPWSADQGFTAGSWMAKPDSALAAGNPEYKYTAFVGNWGDKASIGIQWDLVGCKLGINQMPGAMQPGDILDATIYWTNTTNGKTIKYVLGIEFKEETDITPDIDVVATIDTLLLYNPDEELKISIDKEAILAALGATADTEADVKILAAATAAIYEKNDGLFTLFNDKGYAYVLPDDVDDVYEGTVGGEITKWVLKFDEQEQAFEKGDESKGVLRYAFELGLKRVLYTVTVLSEESPILAIGATPAAKAAPAAAYTLSGTRLGSLQKGINIVRYADGTVKKVLVK